MTAIVRSFSFVCLVLFIGHAAMAQTVPTENSVRINPHPCGTLIADLVDALFLLASTSESKDSVQHAELTTTPPATQQTGQQSGTAWHGARWLAPANILRDRLLNHGCRSPNRTSIAGSPGAEPLGSHRGCIGTQLAHSW
jgi:hypothetical protein